MKKTLLALSLLSAFVGAASAQSTVTLFGIVDANLRQIDNNGTKVRQLGTDGLSSSRLGFRGTEDLGGGLKAGFWLEAALNPDTGTINSSNKFWHRRATVSLESSMLGELRLGRDYAPTYTGISDFDAFGDNGVGKITNLQSKLTGTVETNSRVDNEVQFILPKEIGGVYGTLATAPGEGAIGTKYFGGRVGYLGGGLNVSVSYGQTDANAASDKYKLGTLGAAYDFGFMRLLGSFTSIKFVSREEAMINLGATVPVGPGVIRASFGRADLKGGAAGSTTASDADATLLAVGYVHNLSKRTALYGTYAQIDNKGAQVMSVGSTTPALPGGKKSAGLEFGLRHSF